MDIDKKEFKYGKEVGMLIINPLIKYLCLDVNGEIDESGVWLADDLCDPYGDVSWIPAYSLEGTPNAPDGLTTPALPFPFTARELAAFAVGGLGDSLFGFYLDESGELSQERLNNMGRGAGHARKALTEAFNLYCAAEAKVIKRDNDLEQLDHQMRTKSHDARLAAMDREGVHEHHISQEEYERRHAKAMASFAHIEEESDRLKAEAHTERDAWRKAMVLELLGSKSAALEPLPPPVQKLASQHTEPSDSQTGPEVNIGKTVELENTRRNLLTPLIEAAQKEVKNKFDAPTVWVVLTRMARDRVKPMTGICEDGIQWTNANDETQYLSLKSLRERLNRAKKNSIERDKTR